MNGFKGSYKNTRRISVAWKKQLGDEKDCPIWLFDVILHKLKQMNQLRKIYVDTCSLA